MKTRCSLLILAMVVLSSMSLKAQVHRDTVIIGNDFRYEGEWYQGDGILYSEKDGIIMGKFTNAQPDGDCICYRPSGECYVGEFSRGRATGQAAVFRENGAVMVGGFRKGRYHGIDTLYRPDGSVLVAAYDKGKLITKIAEYDTTPPEIKAKRPYHPRVELTAQQKKFLEVAKIKYSEKRKRLMLDIVMPTFLGGDIEDFSLWVESQVRYPASARVHQLQGVVIAQFVVTKEGKVEDVAVIKGIDKTLDKEVVKAISKSPDWTPAEQDGEKKAVRLTVPVQFVL